MKIIIELTKEEALVLFEFVSRFNENDHNDIFNDQAEQKVLWILENKFESKLEEPFLENYKDILEKAYKTVREE